MSTRDQAVTTFHGYRDNPLDFFRGHKSILLIPSNKPETFSLIILEAFKNKILVLASKSGAHTELIKNKFNGFFIKKLNEKEIIKSLNYIMKKKNRNVLKNAYKFYNNNFKNTNFNNSIKKIINVLFN